MRCLYIIGGEPCGLTRADHDEDLLFLRLNPHAFKSGERRATRKPKLSHKTYVLIADAIANLSPVFGPSGIDIRPRVAEALADSLAGTNPAFSRDRFIAAATGKPYTRRDVQR